MKRSSIFIWITLIFILASIGIGASYLLSLKYMKATSKVKIQKRFDFISQTLLWQLNTTPNPNKMIADLEKIDLLPITYPKEVIDIIKHAKVLKRRKTTLGEVILLKKGNDYYIWIQSFGNTLLLKDISASQQYDRLLYTAIFVIMVVLLLLIYILIIVKLRPLKTIASELEKFSKGDLDLSLSIHSSKELNEVANAINKAAQSLKSIQNSRKLLLRNIMHELKTPITKGRIQAEMIADAKQKQRLIQIFEKLNSLINELAAIEAVNAKIEPNLENIPLKDLIDEAINIGMFDKNEIEIVIDENPIIQADYKLFAIAIKNLIDNGLKYAKDGKVTLLLHQDSLQIVNRADPLLHPLDYYLEPFTKDGKRSGFGLGLYLVDHILKMHHFPFTYHHENGKNIFTIFFPHSAADAPKRSADS